MAGSDPSIEKGKIHTGTGMTDVGDMAWVEHPKFKGVMMKHLVRGADTEGRFSAHFIHITDGSEIGDHIHVNEYELHEVVGGRGKCILGDKIIEYLPGVCAVVPNGINHRVVPDSGGDGMYLLAKFIPALL